MNTGHLISPTPYQDINLVLQTLLDGVRAVLGNYFIGMYLYGSLAIGGFEPGRSDIDFLVATNKELPEKVVSDLEAMHKRIYESGLEWATKLEGSYIPIDAMRRYKPNDQRCPMINEGKLLVACHDADWVLNRHILYKNGLVIAGPPLRSLIDPVRPEELREAVLSLLRNNWTLWLSNANLFDREGYQPYVVLTMCRALYTLENEIVATKMISAEWTMKRSGKRWAKLIGQALSWRQGDPPVDIGETQKFMQYMFKEAGISRK